MQRQSLAVTARSDCLLNATSHLDDPANNVHPATKQLDDQMQPTSLPSSLTGTPQYAAQAKRPDTSTAEQHDTTLCRQAA